MSLLESTISSLSLFIAPEKEDKVRLATHVNIETQCFEIVFSGKSRDQRQQVDEEPQPDVSGSSSPFSIRSFSSFQDLQDYVNSAAAGPEEVEEQEAERQIQQQQAQEEAQQQQQQQQSQQLQPPTYTTITTLLAVGPAATSEENDKEYRITLAQPVKDEQDQFESKTYAISYSSLVFGTLKKKKSKSGIFKLFKRKSAHTEELEPIMNIRDIISIRYDKESFMLDENCFKITYFVTPKVEKTSAATFTSAAVSAAAIFLKAESRKEMLDVILKLAEFRSSL